MSGLLLTIHLGASADVTGAFGPFLLACVRRQRTLRTCGSMRPGDSRFVGPAPVSKRVVKCPLMGLSRNVWTDDTFPQIRSIRLRDQSSWRPAQGSRTFRPAPTSYSPPGRCDFFSESFSLERQFPYGVLPFTRLTVLSSFERVQYRASPLSFRQPAGIGLKLASSPSDETVFSGNLAARTSGRQFTF